MKMRTANEVFILGPGRSLVLLTMEEFKRLEPKLEANGLTKSLKNRMHIMLTGFEDRFIELSNN